jgi:hypothetical protein
LEEKESGGGGEEEECGNEERKVMMCARVFFNIVRERVIGKYYFNIAALPKAVRARLKHTKFSFPHHHRSKTSLSADDDYRLLDARDTTDKMAYTTASNFFRQLGALKVKEVPDFLKKTITKDAVKENAKLFLSEYREKYIKTGSILPVYHAMGAVFATAYVTVWPTEYRHFKAQQEGGGH